MTTREEIKSWLENWVEEGETNKPTHMLVVCDTFSYEDYPVYVAKGQDVRKVYDEYHDKNMQRVIEVYSYRLPLDAQLAERRAYHPD